MKINPSSQQAARQSVDQAAQEAARAAEARKATSGSAAPKGAADPDAVRADSVDVSSAARELAGGREARAAESSLPADRLREIGERLASGFYDSPEVVDQVARRVAADPDFGGLR